MFLTNTFLICSLALFAQTFAALTPGLPPPPPPGLSTVQQIGNEAYNYQINITTSPASRAKFDSHDGKLKIVISGIDRNRRTNEQDFTLTSNAVEIKNGHSYTFDLTSDISSNNIREIKLRWTLKSPFNPYYLVNKPKIAFEPITVTARKSDNGILRSETRQFCSKKVPQLIEHDEHKKFTPCQIY